MEQESPERWSNPAKRAHLDPVSSERGRGYWAPSRHIGSKRCYQVGLREISRKTTKQIRKMGRECCRRGHEEQGREDMEGAGGSNRRWCLC